MKPREFTTPEKAPYQQANQLLERQNHRAKSQRKTQSGLTLKNQHPRKKTTDKRQAQTEQRTEEN
ncbi:hypothetical protein CGI03_23380 [Vibrio parahaemolyticus]|uniref:hypothetical protein n=1 Tax=Vibrio parahaemolyticus TaxID=670 RepID=UPI00046FF8A7|nr:hypothetical protein [Vibrio parahaemolyticus]EIF8963263.1 hypothetical protein [Vibrio parahaemolyticus]EIO4088703.1 hypothetical protein [Vibrio parahaemolyticus]TOL13226.1 hypothetical protein CGI03_23380 [Vibrio parahaemolyticus]TOL54958.1 hypothetical protein CGH95_22575 [Vibrio parahaemolyticus]TOL81122.1 hypothetical protein CGH89_23750 [Vibrio parahaemolyticus]